MARYKYLSHGILSPVWVHDEEQKRLKEDENKEEERRRKRDAELDKKFEKSLMSVEDRLNLSKAKIELINKYKDHPEFELIKKIIEDI